MGDGAGLGRRAAARRADDAAERPESIARASFLEVFGAITLANPTWTIVRHPLRFERYGSNPGAAVHYLYAALGLLLLVSNWTGAAEAGDGGDAAPELALVNRLIAPIGRHARLEGADIIPVMLLAGNIVGGLTAYAICRWLTRRSAPARAAGAASQTLAATAYLGGVSSIVFAIGLVAARGDTDALPAQLAGFALLVLVYVWGVWIRRIHGLAMGRTKALLFPFVLAFASLASFAAITSFLKLALGGTVEF